MSFTQSIKDEAIILRKQPFGEADVMLTIFTLGHGKLRVLAKGARRSSSRLVGHTEPFSLINGQINTQSKIPILSQVTVDHSVLGLAEDLVAIQRISILAEIIDKSFEEGEVSQPVYRVLCEGSLRLRSTANPLLFVGVLVRLLSLMGYAPEITYCVTCKTKLQAGSQYGWSSEAGGVIADACLKESGVQTQMIESDLLKALRFLQRQPLATMARIQTSPELAEKLYALLLGYTRYVLEQPLVTSVVMYS